MKTMKFFIYLFFILLFITSSLAVTLFEDDFGTSEVDSTLWVNDSSDSTAYIEQSSGSLIVYGNLTTSSFLGVFYQTKPIIPSGNDSSVYVSIRANTSIGNNKHYYIGVNNHVQGNPFYSAPPTYCGILIWGNNGNYKILRDYPTASVVTTIQAVDTNLHDVQVNVIRSGTDTQYEIFWDSILVSTVTQDSACINPTLNVSIGMVSTANVYSFVFFDDFAMTTYTNLNETGDYCNNNADCLSGLCEYNFCVLKVGRAECTSNSQCLSGVCSNEHCTDPDAWVKVEAVKTQLFGDSESSNNMIALVIIIGVPIMIVLAIASTVPEAIGIVIAMAILLMYVLAFFMTIIGWLSPFILLGFIMVALIGMALKFIGSSGG